MAVGKAIILGGDLGELRHQGIQRRLSESAIVFGYFITAKHSVQLTHAVVGRHSYIVCSMADSFDSILCSLNLLVKAEVELLQHPEEGRVLGDHLLA